jgi:regulator of protease activity HflC (stomatin/prohibitin superfamily)
MGLLLLLIFVTLAVLCLFGMAKAQSGGAKRGLALLALFLLAGGLIVSSVVYVPSDRTGIVTKHAFGSSLEQGKIIAVDGEMGVQADILAPGWHFGYVPGIYSVRTVDLVTVASDDVGLIEAADGIPLEGDQLFAPDFKPDEFQRMLDARFFLTDGKGFKGKQASVLKPGRYRINTALYRVTMVKQTEILSGEVGVLKANYGTSPTLTVTPPPAPPEPGQPPMPEDPIKLAAAGEMGIRAEVLPPGKYAINTDAFTVTEMWSTQMIAHYTSHSSGIASSQGVRGGEESPASEEREITVRTMDGFTFPVDVRVEYLIKPQDAPLAVAKLGDDEGDRFRNAMNSAVRAIFRNNAEDVKALDYVQMRSTQESQSLAMLRSQMARFGVTVTAVRIGNVGDEKSLGELLKTQTDREIAKQEQLTFQEQQKAADQKKELTRSTQEAEEERKLATATYEVKIADEAQKRKVIEAKAEAEATKIKAVAQADAYRQIAEQIGRDNAALLEVLKVVGERNIQIAPRVLVTGSSGDGAGSALVGTLLDRITTEPEAAPSRTASPAPRPAGPGG